MSHILVMRREEANIHSLTQLRFVEERHKSGHNFTFMYMESHSMLFITTTIYTHTHIYIARLLFEVTAYKARLYSACPLQYQYLSLSFQKEVNC